MGKWARKLEPPHRSDKVEVPRLICLEERFKSEGGKSLSCFRAGLGLYARLGATKRLSESEPYLGRATALLKEKQNTTPHSLASIPVGPLFDAVQQERPEVLLVRIPGSSADLLGTAWKSPSSLLKPATTLVPLSIGAFFDVALSKNLEFQIFAVQNK